MVDKNSSIKPIFKTLNETLTRATEIPFEAGSDIVVEPVLRFLVPGTSPEDREKIKADIAAKDETQAIFLERARGRIDRKSVV